MAKEPRYKPQELEEKVEEWFASITRWVVVQEEIPTGEKDEYGHAVMQTVPVVNSLGENVLKLEFIIPPMLSDLYRHLGISATTWAAYGQRKAYAEIVKRTRGRVYAYLQGETLTRPDKMLGGILFNIRNNYAEYAEREALELEKLRREVARMDDRQEGLKVLVEIEKAGDGYGG